MISLCAPVSDTNGQVVSATGGAEAKNISRRAQRVATLDGGAVLVDGGYSPSDLTYTLRLPDADGRQHTALRSLLSSHQTAVLSCADGCYLVLLSAISHTQGVTRGTAEVLEALN